MLGKILLLLVFQLAKQGLIHARPSHDPGQTGQCPSTGLPSGGLRHLNVIHEGKPRYRLDLRHAGIGYVPGHTYTIYIHAQDPSQTFGDVLLSVSSESRTCQHGNFSIQSQYYYQPEGCDHMVLKNTREFEHTFTFHWTAPTCGCVNLRARVKSADNIYYLDNENIIDGYLTKRVCRRHMSTIISKISHSERENLLCRVVSSSDDWIANEGHFLQRRKMDLNLMTVLERDALQISLHQRIYQVQRCCVLTGTAKTDCLGDIRRHRIDRLCASTLHMPFSVRSNAYMTERRDNCCWRLGERRYDCFAMGHQGEGVPPQNDVHTDVAMVTGVNVLDESDPANDLEDYPNRLSEELVQLNTYHEELEPENKDVAADKGNVHHNDLVPTLPSNVHKDEKMPAVPSHKTNQQVYQPVTQEVFPLHSPPKEDLGKMVPTPQTQSLTQTTAGLEKKLRRAKVELECCQQGKEYGVGLVTGDTWDRCEQRTRKVSKAMKGKNRRWCRRYHMRCCVESVHSSQRSVRIENSMTHDHNLEMGTTGPQRSEVQSSRVKVMTGGEERKEKETDDADDDDDDVDDDDDDNDDDDDDDNDDDHDVDDDDDVDDNDDDDDDDDDDNDDDHDVDDHDVDDDNNDVEESMNDSEETRNTNGDEEDSDGEDVDIVKHQEYENTTPAGKRSVLDESQVANNGGTSSSVTGRVNQDGSLSREQHWRPIIHSHVSTDLSGGSWVSTDQSQGSTDQSQGSTDQSQGSMDQSQGSTDQSRRSTDQLRGSTDQSQVSTDQSQGSTDQVFSEFPKTDQSSDSQLAQSSDHSNNLQPVETVKPSSGKQHSEIMKGEGKLRRRKQPKSMRKGRKSRRKGRKNRRRGRKHTKTGGMVGNK